MKAIVLGSAAGGGFPQWNCRCPNCRAAWERDPDLVWRTQSSLGISPDGSEWLIVDASPDIGVQVRQNSCLWPRGSRSSPIGAIILTSAEIDHVTGLLSLREGHRFELVATPQVLSAIDDNPIFRAVQAHARPAVMEEPFTVCGVSITLFPAPGKAALYREGDDPKLNSESGETVGLFVRGPNLALAYIPGCAAISAAVDRHVRSADVVLFDGTLFADDEMIETGVGRKTGLRMGHMPIDGDSGSLQFLSQLSDRRRIYTHINNTNPILRLGSRQRALVEQAGVEIAHDGLEITL